MLCKFTQSSYKSVFDSKNSHQDPVSYKLNFNNILQEANQSKIKDISSVGYRTYREKDSDQLTVILVDQDQVVEQFTLTSAGNTTTTLQNHLRRICPSSSILCFQTLDSQTPIDYFLSLPDMPLTSLNVQTLHVKPLYQTQQFASPLTLDSFHFIQCIGVGGFSRVYLVRSKYNGLFLALKLVSKKFILDNQKEQIIQNERDILVTLSQASHPFLCRLLCSFETRNWVCFGLEYCPGGELFQQLRKVKRMTEPDARVFFAEVCMAVHHLHQNNIIYRDIKPENILLDQQGHIKLADFGLARPDMEDEQLAYSFCGSPEYMAPEMLTKEGHNSQIDHYCLGALLYELLTGLPPYYSRDTEEIYSNILSQDLTFPPGVGGLEVRDLIRKLLEKDRESRLGKVYGIYEILNHPWMKKMSTQAILSKQLVPPFKPNLLAYNFDRKEVTKGDSEFKKKLYSSLVCENENHFTPMFPQFHFIDRKYEENEVLLNMKKKLQNSYDNSVNFLSVAQQDPMKENSKNQTDTSLLNRACSAKQIFQKRMEEQYQSQTVLKNIQKANQIQQKSSSKQLLGTSQKTPLKNTKKVNDISQSGRGQKSVRSQDKKRPEKPQIMRMSQPQQAQLITEPENEVSEFFSLSKEQIYDGVKYKQGMINNIKKSQKTLTSILGDYKSSNVLNNYNFNSSQKLHFDQLKYYNMK